MRVINSMVLGTVLAVAAAAPAAAASFDGPFVGAQVGWQSEKMRNPKSSFGTVPVSDTNNNVTGGVFVGYDKAIGGRFVVGGEASLDFASDDEVQNSVGTKTYSVDPKYSYDLTARAGYLVTPETLIYARGGYTNARVRTTVTNASMITSNSSNQDG